MVDDIEKSISKNIGKMPKHIFRIFLIIFLVTACIKNPESTSSDPESPSTHVVDLVYPLLDAANSRWFFFNTASRPFGLVNLSPDTQMGGTWGSGYRYHTDTIKGFSHIHAWQLAGLSIMPVTIPENASDSLLQDYYSSFQHEDEVAEVGYQSIHLDRYDVKTEITSSTRAGFHRIHFPDNSHPGIIINLGGILGPSQIVDGQLHKITDTSLAGQLVNAPTIRRPKPITVFFHMEFDSPILSITEGSNGKYLVALNPDVKSKKIKVGLSYTSIENAKVNLDHEIPHWDFDGVVKASKNEWNNLLSRIQIKGGSLKDQRRFYTDLWHALQGRRIISDVSGAYPDNTGKTFRIGQLPLDIDGKPEFNHYNSDSFWGAQWTLNTLWGMVYPDYYEEFVQSLIQYYKDGGLIPRGPSGGNYTNVMTGASSTPFIVSAYQKGIRGFDALLAYEGLKKNHMPGGMMGRAGYEHSTAKGGGLEDYISKGYVPFPNPDGDFGYHQDGASLTLEYAYQDWTLAQLAKALKNEKDYQYFMERSQNYQNQFDQTSGWMRPKDINGSWKEPFDPYLYENGFNESNGAQSTWFVPHDIQGLAALMGGTEAAVDKLNQQFEKAQQDNFTSGTSHDRERDPERSRIPINYGNQPSIQTAFIFHLLGRPDLGQYWSRAIVEQAFSGLSPTTGYNGDEDQGLMGALSVLLKIGLFQMNGGTEANPVYQIGSPIFDQIVLKLHPDYAAGKEFVIEINNNGEEQYYVAEIWLNDQKLNTPTLHHQDIINGGKLKLRMNHKVN